MHAARLPVRTAIGATGCPGGRPRASVGWNCGPVRSSMGMKGYGVGISARSRCFGPPGAASKVPFDPESAQYPPPQVSRARGCTGVLSPQSAAGSTIFGHDSGAGPRRRLRGKRHQAWANSSPSGASASSTARPMARSSPDGLVPSRDHPGFRRRAMRDSTMRRWTPSCSRCPFRGRGIWRWGMSWVGRSDGELGLRSAMHFTRPREPP